MENNREYSEYLRDRFRLLHQILRIKDGALFWVEGEASEAFSDRESELYDEAMAILEISGEKNKTALLQKEQIS